MYGDRKGHAERRPHPLRKTSEQRRGFSPRFDESVPRSGQATVLPGGSMVGTCANPDCNVPFRYFRTGQLFMVETREPQCRSRTDHSKRGIEYFWLCGDCVPTMHLMRTTDGAVTVCRTPQTSDRAMAPKIGFAREVTPWISAPG